MRNLLKKRLKKKKVSKKDCEHSFVFDSSYRTLRFLGVANPKLIGVCKLCGKETIVDYEDYMELIKKIQSGGE